MKHFFFIVAALSLCACTQTAFTPPTNDLQKMVYCYIDGSAGDAPEDHPYKGCEEPAQQDNRVNLYTKATWTCIQQTHDAAEKAFAAGHSYTAPNGDVMDESGYGPTSYCGIRGTTGNGLTNMHSIRLKTIEATESDGIVEVRGDDSIAGGGIRFFLIKENGHWKINKSEFLDDPFVQ